MKEFLISNWNALSSLLLSVVTIVIAIWSARQTSKDATRQIASIKELSRVQIDASIRQVEMEIERNIIMAKQARYGLEVMENINNSGLSYDGTWREKMIQKSNEEKPKRDFELYCTFINDLQTIKNSLVKANEQLK